MNNLICDNERMQQIEINPSIYNAKINIYTAMNVTVKHKNKITWKIIIIHDT